MASNPYLIDVRLRNQESMLGWPRFWGLSVKISPTERLWKQSNFIKEYDKISLLVIFHHYHYLISKNISSYLPLWTSAKIIDLVVTLVNACNRKLTHQILIFGYENSKNFRSNRLQYFYFWRTMIRITARKIHRNTTWANCDSRHLDAFIISTIVHE